MTYEQAKQTPKNGWKYAEGDHLLSIYADVIAKRCCLIPKAVYKWSKKTKTKLDFVFSALAEKKISDIDVVSAVLNDTKIE